MNILKKIGERFPQKLQHVPIDKFVESEGIIDATGYSKALSRRQTGLGALAVGGVGIGGGLAYRKLQSNKSEFAQQPDKKEGLSNAQKVGLGLGGLLALRGGMNLHSLRKTAKAKKVAWKEYAANVRKAQESYRY